MIVDTRRGLRVIVPLLIRVAFRLDRGEAMLAVLRIERKGRR